MKKKQALQQLLENYRDTPHPATGITPAAMMFRDGQAGTFPRLTFNERQIETARKIDSEKKTKRQNENNTSKYVKKK